MRRVSVPLQNRPESEKKAIKDYCKVSVLQQDLMDRDFDFRYD